MTIEKFQWPANASQEATIVNVLKGVKAINPNVSTIFYYNSVLDFPQYDLAKTMAAKPQLMLHNAEGGIVKMSGGGHTNMDVFDFGNAEMRALFIEECVNATQTGYVDGCFLDRAVDGTPTDSTHGDLTPCMQSAGDCRCVCVCVCARALSLNSSFGFPARNLLLTSSLSPNRYHYNLSDATAEAYFKGHIKGTTPPPRPPAPSPAHPPSPPPCLRALPSLHQSAH